MALTIADLRRHAVANSLFPPTTLKRALDRMQFVQADPIRAPARAQDLILRHRVNNYRAGDLERLYAKRDADLDGVDPKSDDLEDVDLEIEEDFFINYGFVTRPLQRLMHPRTRFSPWRSGRQRQAQDLLQFVRERGTVHPREVDDHFAHGTVTNYWGGVSNATTHLLDGMHYRGLLRVVRRENGIRIYAAHEHDPGPTDAAARIRRIHAPAWRPTVSRATSVA